MVSKLGIVCYLIDQAKPAADVGDVRRSGKLAYSILEFRKRFHRRSANTKASKVYGLLGELKFIRV